MSVALQEGQRLLYSGRAALAIPAALQAVRYLRELGSAEDGGVSGDTTDIAPAYLILSEAAIRELAFDSRTLGLESQFKLLQSLAVCLRQSNIFLKCSG